MATFTRTKRIYVGGVMAEIEVSMTDELEAWGPHINPSELDRIDRLRRALKAGDMESAAKEAKLYSITPLAV